MSTVIRTPGPHGSTLLCLDPAERFAVPAAADANAEHEQATITTVTIDPATGRFSLAGTVPDYSTPEGSTELFTEDGDHAADEIPELLAAASQTTRDTLYAELHQQQQQPQPQPAAAPAAKAQSYATTNTNVYDLASRRAAKQSGGRRR